MGLGGKPDKNWFGHVPIPISFFGLLGRAPEHMLMSQAHEHMLVDLAMAKIRIRIKASQKSPSSP